MSLLSPPVNSQNWSTTGDVDVFAGVSADNGDGTIYVRNGGLYVTSLTDLNHTTINTNSGVFTVMGSNNAVFNMSSSIQLTATSASFFTTSAGTLTLNSTGTDSTGKITLNASGIGADSIKLNASNTTSGQITLTSAGGSTSITPIQLTATDTTNGYILVQGAGNMASSNPAVTIQATNSTSGQVFITSAGNDTTTNAIKITATATTDGDVFIQGAGNMAGGNPAVFLQATNTTSGQIRLSSAGGSTTIDSLQILATDTTNGHIVVKGSGNNASSNPAVKIWADNSTSGKIQLLSAGTGTDAIQLNSTAGGVDIEATALIGIQTTDTTNGVKIATATTGIPVAIGTSTSVTTISGSLVVSGTTTQLNTVTTTVEDNVLLLNSGSGILDQDAGLIIHRFQSPNNAGTGDVVTTPNPIQESGAFQTGSATPATLKLASFASSSDNFYNGWWIKVTSGTGNNQVRRIKSYVGSTKVATIYATSDNSTSSTAPFSDGLDLVTAPASGDTYSFYSGPYVASYQNETGKAWANVTTALIPSAVTGPSASTIGIQQYFQTNTGAINVIPQVYNNMSGSASGTTITFTHIGHSQVTGARINIANSSGFTPAITTGTYVLTNLTANTFSITVSSTTTSVGSASASVTYLSTSSIAVNNITTYNTGAGGLQFPGFSVTQDVVIPKTSTAVFTLNNIANTYGAYLVIIADLNNTNGAFTVANVTSAGTGASINTAASSKGSDGQRIQPTMASGQVLGIQQSPSGSGSGSYTYRVRIIESYTY